MVQWSFHLTSESVEQGNPAMFSCIHASCSQCTTLSASCKDCELLFIVQYVEFMCICLSVAQLSLVTSTVCCTDTKFHVANISNSTSDSGECNKK